MTAAAVKQLVDDARPVRVRVEPLKPADPLEALARWMVTDEQVNAMKETMMICGNRIARSHLAGWVAPPNGGKTTIAKFASGELAADGYRVLFFQEDASAGDLPALYEHSKSHGYQLLNSTLSGSNTDEQLKVLRGLAKTDGDLSSVVMFFDTLKKYTDLMSKGGARAFFQLMRALTQRGATIVLLGHTNKHRGVDGKLIFEGVGDVRSDVDELIYIEATDKDAAGLVTLTMRPDKVRCAIEECSFVLDTRTMRLAPLDRVVDVRSIRQAEEQRAEDADLIDIIDRLLADGGMAHTQLVGLAKDASGASRRRLETVIGRYSSASPGAPEALWSETRLASSSNTRHIARMPGRPG